MATGKTFKKKSTETLFSLLTLSPQWPWYREKYRCYTSQLTHVFQLEENRVRIVGQNSLTS